MFVTEWSLSLTRPTSSSDIGNILKLDEPTEDGHVLALIDCGLMASIQEEDRDHMISAVIHLANKDYPSLVDDFMNLKILPADSDRAAIIPLMDKALSPYVKGGGAKKYEEELKKLYGMEDGSHAEPSRGLSSHDTGCSYCSQ